jgi:hypothetical protein
VIAVMHALSARPRQGGASEARLNSLFFSHCFPPTTSAIRFVIGDVFSTLRTEERTRLLHVSFFFGGGGKR